MQDSRREEHDKTGDLGAITPGTHGRVDMSLEELVNWLVPGPPVFAKASAVPPRVVEGSVTKPCQLGQRVQERLK